MTRDKIALFLHNLEGGGAERVTLTLADCFRARGLHVDLVVGQLAGELASAVPDGVRVVELNAGRALACIPGLVRYLRREQPDALLSALEQNNFAALCAHRLSRSRARMAVGVHCTLSVGTAHSPTWRDSLLPLLAARFYPWADEIVAVSQGAADDLATSAKIPRDRIRVVYNPVITQTMLDKALLAPSHPWLTEPGPPVVLAVANFTIAKDYPTLIRAFRRLRDEREARLLVLGEGAERPKVEALVRELGLSADVSMPGYEENPYACMTHAAVYVMSSRFEALPTSMIEALGCGLSVVSTDCPSGPSEILEGGTYGRLVPVGDSDALADAIGATLDARTSPEKLRRRADAFRPEPIVDEYLELLLPGRRE